MSIDGKRGRKILKMFIFSHIKKIQVEKKCAPALLFLDYYRPISYLIAKLLMAKIKLKIEAKQYVFIVFLAMLLLAESVCTK